MRYREFILEDFKTAKAAFVKQGANPDEIEQTVANFRDLTRKNQFQGDEKNIDWWAKQGWEAFKQRVDIIAQTPTRTALKRSKIQGRAIELPSPNPKWGIYIPLDKEASCNIGTGTDWCTTKPNQSFFESYFYDRGVILVYLIGSNTKYAMAMHKDIDKIEFFTKTDSSINQREFETKTGLKVEDIKPLVMQNIDQITAEQQAGTVKDPQRALKHALSQNAPFPEGEAAIATNAETAYQYANAVLKGRFERGEPMILRDPKASLEYAKNVIKAPWPAAESAIAKDPSMAYQYAKSVLKAPWPAAEPVIATDRRAALQYAAHILKGRFPEYELYALKNAITALDYIKTIVKGPWPAAEPVLKTSYGAQLEYEKLTGKKI